MFDIFWSPLGASAADVMGGTSLTLSAVLAFFPLKCQASSVLRCSTVYLLPLLSTLLIDAICAVITPLVIKQHFSLPVSGCQALLPRSVVVLFFFSCLPLFRSTADNDLDSPKKIAWEGGFCIRRCFECEEKVWEKFKKGRQKKLEFPKNSVNLWMLPTFFIVWLC